MFNRVYTRAQKRYYNYGWQFLEHPESQPASIWSKLPDEVIRHMACVADWVCAVESEEAKSISLSRFLGQFHSKYIPPDANPSNHYLFFDFGNITS